VYIGIDKIYFNSELVTMVTLHCPNCQARLKTKNPLQDPGVLGWVKCPRCGEIFQAQKADTESLLAVPEKKLSPGQWSGTGNPGRNQSCGSVKITVPEIGKSSLPCAPMERHKGARPIFKVLVLSFLGVILAGTLAWGFRASHGPGPKEIIYTAVLSDDYNQSLLSADLLTLKRDLHDFSRADKQIDFSGHESRVYNYLASLLSEESCRDVSGLHIYSENTSLGFKAQGVCLEAGKKAAVINVAWLGTKARIEVDQENQFLELDLPD
jgi:hypothetical protein